MAESLNNLAGLYYALGRYEAVEPLLQRALAIREQTLGPEHPRVALVRENYAALLRARQREAAPLRRLWQRLRTWLLRPQEIR